MTQPIPRPSGLPILGNVFDISPSNTWASLKKLAEQHGEIFQVKVLGQTIVFAASVALAEELCDEKRFRKYVGGPIVEIRAAVHDSLFTAYDNEASWGIAHRIVAPHLAPDALRGDALADTVRTTRELIAKWSSGGTVSPLAELNRLNLEATTLILYGMKLDCLSGPEHPMIQAMEDSTSEAMMRPTRPPFFNTLLYKSKFKAAIKGMRSYAADVVAHREANPTEKKDLLAALMNGKDPETGKGLSQSQVIDEIVTMPIGSSTAPCLLASAILFLLQNPDKLAAMRRETDAVAGSGEWTAAAVDKLHYVHGVVRESLRLSFAAPGFNIEPIPRDDDDVSPVSLAGGKYEIAHDQAVIIVLAGVNRDPAVFEDPLAFRPERMMGDAFDALPAGAKKWFGNGKRECIGRQYAWQWSVLVLAMMVHHIDFEMVDKNYVLEQDGWFNFRPVGFKVKVKPRAA